MTNHTAIDDIHDDRSDRATVASTLVLADVPSTHTGVPSTPTAVHTPDAIEWGRHIVHEVPDLVGEPSDAARAFAHSAGLSFVERDVPPRQRSERDGVVVHQYPQAWADAHPGSTLAVDVVRRETFWQRYALTAALVALAGALMLAAVFAFTTSAEQSAAERQVVALEQQADNFEEVLAGAQGISTDLVDGLDTRLRDLQAEYAETVEAYDGEIATYEEITDEYEVELAASDEAVAIAESEIEALEADLDALIEESEAAARVAEDDITALNETLATTAEELVVSNEALATTQAGEIAAIERADRLRAELDAANAAAAAEAAASTPMPDFVGQQRVRVERFARSNDIRLRVVEVPSSAAAVGTVLQQAPAAGVSTRAGSAAWIEVAAAP